MSNSNFKVAQRSSLKLVYKYLTSPKRSLELLLPYMEDFARASERGSRSSWHAARPPSPAPCVRHWGAASPRRLSRRSPQQEFRQMQRRTKVYEFSWETCNELNMHVISCHHDQTNIFPQLPASSKKNQQTGLCLITSLTLRKTSAWTNNT